jgi:hypothetical protein
MGQLLRNLLWKGAIFEKRNILQLVAQSAGCARSRFERFGSSDKTGARLQGFQQ